MRHGSSPILHRIGIVIAACCFVAAAARTADGQRVIAKERYLGGAFIGYQGNFYSGNFPVFNGGTDCGVFESGSGWRPSFGLTMEIPLSRKVNFAPRLYWDDRSGVFSVTHTDYSAMVDSVPQQVDLQHTLTTTLRQISLDLPVKWMPFPKNNFYFLSGFSLGYILSGHYVQVESILSPSNAVFRDIKKQDRTLADANFTTLSKFQYGLNIGLGYDLPISKYAFLAPEIVSVFGLNSAVTDASWTIITMRFEVAIKGDITSWFRDEKEIEPIPSQSENPQPANPNDRPLNLPTASASIQVMGLTPDGDQTPHPTLKVEEFLSTDLQPTLNYVFFDDNSAELATRYVRMTPEQVANYSDTALIGSGTMELYYNILNLIGRRMTDHPKATLRIKGCNSNRGAEAGNVALSTKRAEIIRDYFVNVWKLDPSRLKVSAQNLPDVPSRVDTTFGMEENRRAELWSDDPYVLAPVTLAGLERTASPPRIRMYMHSENKDLITSWHAEAKERGRVIAHTEGKGSIPSTFDWILSSLADSLIHEEEPMHFALTVVDSAGNENKTETSIQLRALTIRKKREQRIADMRIDKFSLFLFDFDLATLSSRSEAVLALVEKAVSTASTVHVIGFCDRTGEAEHNKQLSEDRARTVADHIVANAHPAHITSEGRGDTELLFDNALPEGRYFCRTVYVRVETPVEEK